jgi:hypothetical protein
VPHAFAPDLTFRRAMLAVCGALARIFLGSTVFALWGMGAVLAWNAIENPFWGVLAMLPIALSFGLAFGGLMLVVTGLVRKLSDRLP